MRITVNCDDVISLEFSYVLWFDHMINSGKLVHFSIVFLMHLLATISVYLPLGCKGSSVKVVLLVGTTVDMVYGGQIVGERLTLADVVFAKKRVLRRRGIHI